MIKSNVEGRVRREIADQRILASGSASASLGLELRNKRRRTSFYADPVSWLVLEAVEQAIHGCPEDLTRWPEHIGLITLSDVCTVHTMREIEQRLAEGVISPLRFSGANPGAVGSLPSHFSGFSGPTIVFSMPPEEGLTTATMLGRSWLQEGAAKYVILNLHWLNDDGHNVYSAIFSNPEEANEWRG